MEHVRPRHCVLALALNGQRRLGQECLDLGLGFAVAIPDHLVSEQQAAVAEVQVEAPSYQLAPACVQAVLPKELRHRPAKDTLAGAGFAPEDKRHLGRFIRVLHRPCHPPLDVGRKAVITAC